MSADMIAPVRYSIEQDDYNHSIGRRLVISLDGEEQRAVVAYDSEGGWVDRYVLDTDGQAQVDPQNAEQVWMVRAFGTVVVTLTPPPEN